MSGFELVFVLFGIVLGLAVTEVLGGFARVVKLRRSGRGDVRIGWLTPLLGLFVILDQTSFFMVAYHLQRVLTANYLTLLAVLAVSGTYYVASTLIFPDDPEGWPDFDAHYDRQKRFVLAAVLAANLAVLALAIAMAAGAAPMPAAAAPSSHAPGGPSPILILPLVAVAIFVRPRWANAALLALMIALNLWGAVAAALG
ncbi:MAG: hypothetical protein JOZ90_09380 [Alphaproteobacteria bacterium]|nr:hypothetical protein [Alphaproteobacteria bacterium]MBV9371849.1 hypothetical protein [Alphaproteobacteria bacterium]MBV9901296.1 hypothetical protein [Alphaproteobacteria bacterium]